MIAGGLPHGSHDVAVLRRSRPASFTPGADEVPREAVERGALARRVLASRTAARSRAPVSGAAVIASAVTCPASSPAASAARRVRHSQVDVPPSSRVPRYCGGSASWIAARHATARPSAVERPRHYRPHARRRCARHHHPDDQQRSGRRPCGSRVPVPPGGHPQLRPTDRHDSPRLPLPRDGQRADRLHPDDRDPRGR